MAPSATFKEMATQLREQRVSAFPVVATDGKVIGLVSEADLLTKEALDSGGAGKAGGLRRHHEKGKAAGITAGDVMTSPVVTVGPRDFVADASCGRRLFLGQAFPAPAAVAEAVRQLEPGHCAAGGNPSLLASLNAGGDASVMTGRVLAVMCPSRRGATMVINVRPAAPSRPELGRLVVGMAGRADRR